MSKVIIITGASSGIGLALAEYFGKKGNKVYGLSRKTVSSDYFVSIATDITEKEQIDNAISEILKTETRIDVLVNNAGMGMVGSVEDSTKEDITKLFNLNLIGSVQMMTAVLPKMREQKHYPIEPSISNLMRRFISTAYSIGNSFVNGSMKPMTIISVASSCEIPRLIR